MNNGLIKVITGIRRSGKSYLLFELFYKYLKEQGVDDNHIIKLALDDRRNKQYRNPDALCDYVYKKSPTRNSIIFCSTKCNSWTSLKTC